jgi:hypothetical protein
MPSHVTKPSLSAYHKKQKMSLTQTYYLAHTARGKLSKEAAKSDHDLRLLVGHANLLDGLMIDLAEAERQQESWFNSTVAKVSSSPLSSSSEQPKHVQWADSPLPTVAEDFDDGDSDSSSDDSESDDEWESTSTYSATAAPIRRITSPPAPIISESAVEDDDEEEEDEYDDSEHDYEHDDAELQLVRTPSRSSPPELLHESDSEESEDDSMPPSPPTRDIPLDAFSAKQRDMATSKGQSLIPGSPKTNNRQHEEDAFYDEGYYLPQRQTISAY